jgi:hypothetical protein
MTGTEGDQPALLLLIPVFFVIFGGGLAAAIVSLLAFLSGWRALASRFPAPPGFTEGKLFSWQSGRIGIVNYNNILRVRVSAQGLHLACGFPFHFMHPPLLIPWAQITDIKQQKILAWPVTLLTIGTPKIATVTLHNRKILEAAGPWLPQA